MKEFKFPTETEIGDFDWDLIKKNKEKIQKYLLHLGVEENFVRELTFNKEKFVLVDKKVI